MSLSLSTDNSKVVSPRDMHFTIEVEDAITQVPYYTYKEVVEVPKDAQIALRVKSNYDSVCDVDIFFGSATPSVKSHIGTFAVPAIRHVEIRITEGSKGVPLTVSKFPCPILAVFQYKEQDAMWFLSKNFVRSFPLHADPYFQDGNGKLVDIDPKTLINPKINTVQGQRVGRIPHDERYAASMLLRIEEAPDLPRLWTEPLAFVCGPS